MPVEEFHSQRSDDGRDAYRSAQSPERKYDVSLTVYYLPESKAFRLAPPSFPNRNFLDQWLS